MIEGARKIWKQLSLMEDAMLIHRIMRAPEKRVFKIDIGNIPPAEVENFIHNQKKKIKERLQERLDYENSSQFYHCGNNDCDRVTFENALDKFFKCPSCGDVLNLKKNEAQKKGFTKKIDEIGKDLIT